MAAQKQHLSFGSHNQMMMVPLWISHIVRFPGKDGGLEIWGHVGDYEVKICRPNSHDEAKALLRLHKAYLKMMADKVPQRETVPAPAAAHTSAQIAPHQ